MTPMLRHLMYKIKSTGPITVAEYMKEVLTNPAKVNTGEREPRRVCTQRSPKVPEPADDERLSEVLGM